MIPEKQPVSTQSFDDFPSHAINIITRMHTLGNVTTGLFVYII